VRITTRAPRSVLAAIEAGYRGTQSRERFGDEAAAASDVQYLQAGERFRCLAVIADMVPELLANIKQTDGIDLMQRAKFARRIPPFLGDGAEAFDLVLIHSFDHSNFVLISAFPPAGAMFTKFEGCPKFAEFDFWRYKHDAALLPIRTARHRVSQGSCETQLECAP
jgi:hypothetical protein